VAKLNSNFIVELFALCLKSDTDYELVRKYLKDNYHFLSDQAYKTIWKHIVQHHTIEDSVPTIGVLAQMISSVESDYRDISLAVVEKIKNTSILGKRDVILTQFEKFITGQQYLTGVKESAAAYNKGDHDKAIDIIAKMNDNLQSISLFENSYNTVYESMPERIEERNLFAKNKHEIVALKKIPFGIPPLDEAFRGGMPMGSAYLVAAQSGKGKSSFLRHHAITASKCGFNVVYFAFEDTKENFYDYFDSALTGIALANLQDGLYNEKEFDAIKNGTAGYGEILFKNFVSFDPVQVSECRNLLIEWGRKREIHLVLFDYLELMGDEYKGEERHRRIKIAEA
jgi:replicative DNA helicase